MTTLTGTSRLLRFILRRDRLRLAVWVGILAVLPVGTANAFLELYPTELSRQQIVATIGSNPAMVAILGPIQGSSIGALTSWRVGTLGGLLVALMAVLTMIRHTREEEETGRRELLGSTVLGRNAPLAAAVLLVSGTGVVLALAVTGALVGIGLPVEGSLAFGLGYLGIVFVFAAVGAFAAQLSDSASLGRGVGVGVASLAFLLRVAGDGGEASGLGWLSWLSPIGWSSKLRPYAGEEWWVMGLWSALGAGFLAVAGALSARRDVGAGLFDSRPGNPRADRLLASPTGLALRLHRGAFLGWTAGLVAIGLVYGSVADSIGDLLADNPQLAEILELLGGVEAITDVFFSIAVGVLALIASAYSIRTVLRLKAEEESGRAEPVLATRTSRLEWAAGHLLIGLVGPALMLVIGGAIAGASYGFIVGTPGREMVEVAAAAAAQVPAVWVITGFTMAVYGLSPRLTVAAWGFLVACLIVGQLGQILQFPEWSINLSPFSHVPGIPAEGFEGLPLVVLGLIAAGLTSAGLIALRRRDFQPN